ncbi:hypothetical protein [Bradyrhizobium sp. NAS96.2]|uniref:hypothetical protein n=1 Tax=Bradyrhizobium sp. NAS96.2 TaxID=1680160 RepID=UPI0009643C18|nr:hypothetical protein [Bradyrhizobium sp. NAS96.2]OKO84267.1 hypothetical protein AC628_00135 [Bradyrhizobium sp. NAS96.2]
MADRDVYIWCDLERNVNDRKIAFPKFLQAYPKAHERLARSFNALPFSSSPNLDRVMRTLCPELVYRAQASSSFEQWWSLITKGALTDRMQV